MKKLFTAIRQFDNETVKQLLQKKPELIACTAKQPPKKDDGQSPLQVSLKCGNFEITDFLLSLNADVNFIESEECCNNWRAPVIHDAINAAIMCSRWNTTSFGFKEHSTKENAEKAFIQLQKIIQLGANVNAKDSYGNSCIWRACLQASQILPQYNYQDKILSKERVITEALKNDLSKIFELLLKSGADLQYIRPNVNANILDFYKQQPVYKFLI
ncbi:MAG: ankyrin repeat domain-containing protein [Lachnospiraceae bacterium]|nr:ankyrin repeat domain-containing protein [Lachnospiraceae bacterium]